MNSYFVHQSAVIDEGAEIGPGTNIWHFSHIMQGCRIGSNCIIGQNVFLASGVILGDGVKIQNNISIYTGVKCEDDVFIGPSVVFTNVINPRAFIERKHEYRSTIIKRGASIGANSTIICGVTIGSYALIGAGSVVTRDIPAYALAFGSPARIKGWVCKCGVKLDFTEAEAACKTCGLNYILNNGLVVCRESTD
jgi:UDP-2-acetamido-3-amino-2,3-dideoxy-glucuronate N-acetyltransferase